MSEKRTIEELLRQQAALANFGSHSFALPAFYAVHKIVATADVLIKGKGQPWGVLEIDTQSHANSINMTSAS
jgi:hypothetical protein